MNIVHVFKDFYPPLAAGITGYLHDVTDWCARAGHHVEVHVAGVKSSRRDVMANGVIVHRHREWSRALSTPVAPGLVRETRTINCDVLHVHMPNPIGEVAAYLNVHRVPIVASFHARLGRQQFLEPVYGPFRRALLGRASAVLVSSESMAQSPELAGFATKVSVLPYGVSPRFAQVERSPTPEAADLRLLFVGRLVYYKGLDVLLRALRNVDRARLTIVGDGPLRTELEALASTLGVADRVQFLGVVSDEELRLAYADHDVFVLPSVSRAEAFGLAMVEAMASGLPVVSTELQTGTSWVNIDGVSGLVVPPNDAAALASALERLRSTALRTDLEAGARNRALDVFSFEHHCLRLMETYERAAAVRA